MTFPAEVLLRLHQDADPVAEVRIEWAELTDGSTTIQVDEARDLRDRLTAIIEAADCYTDAHPAEGDR